MHLINKTACELMAVPMVSQHDDNYLVVVVKATFDLLFSEQRLKLSPTQLPIHQTDQYWGEPDQSSVRYTSDVVLLKPTTDVGVLGSAYAPGGSATTIAAQVRVGHLTKMIAVHGDRIWEKRGVGYEISKPASFSKMPLVYENAYGGSYFDQESGTSVGEPRNPVGKGFYHSDQQRQPDVLHVPNLEHPNHLLSEWQQPLEPCCPGFIPQLWMPRRNFIGTYDKAWLQERSPLLPRDFDERAHIAAGSGLSQEGYLKGGEPVELLNLHPEGVVRFKLPSQNFSLEVSTTGEVNEHELEMNNVVIEPDDNRVAITWCSNVPIHWNLDQVDFVRLSSRRSAKDTAV